MIRSKTSPSDHLRPSCSVSLMGNWAKPIYRLWRISTALLFAAALVAASSAVAVAQAEDPLGEGSADPIKLFEQGQNAHARGDLARAVTYYQEALKVKPEFPEAEFQLGNVLVALGQLNDAESAYQRSIKLRKDWSLPYAALGALFARTKRNHDAESMLRAALKLNSQDNLALRVLANLRLRSGDHTEALKLAQAATKVADAPASAWLVRAMAERATGDKTAAIASLQNVLQNEPNNLDALLERAELRIEASDYAAAIEDLKAVEKLKSTDKSILSRLASGYERAGKADEARRIAEAAGLIAAGTGSPSGKNTIIGSAEEIEAANNDDATIARPALLKLLEKNPRNAMLLARLGACYRADDPARSLEFYQRAVEIQPENPDYAAGYAAALVRARRFPEATVILRKVISASPDHYVAHANLATALYESKRYPEAIPEYEWLLRTKPDLTIAYYFIASAHDYLGEYPEALAAYETFLARADTKTNLLEIDKVNLRLPTLRRQIKLGEGAKRKP
ncbi:MAG TPA: tetratricopeptide repeat protein [Pyrinomonadaceae bacterium]|nr:tetratricopeptide repeat protein [Pyrinomonadaceae bacterium]